MEIRFLFFVLVNNIFDLLISSFTDLKNVDVGEWTLLINVETY